jgi:hypothetical protein
MDNEKKINSINCKISDQSQLLAEMGGQYWRFPRNTKLNQQSKNKDINLYWKLYRSILSKYRYTSLESIVRLAALMIAHVANFRTSNPVRVAVARTMKNTAPIYGSVKL